MSKTLRTPYISFLYSLKHLTNIFLNQLCGVAIYQVLFMTKLFHLQDLSIKFVKKTLQFDSNFVD